MSGVSNLFVIWCLEHFISSYLGYLLCSILWHLDIFDALLHQRQCTHMPACTCVPIHAHTLMHAYKIHLSKSQPTPVSIQVIPYIRWWEYKQQKALTEIIGMDLFHVALYEFQAQGRVRNSSNSLRQFLWRNQSKLSGPVWVPLCVR